MANRFDFWTHGIATILESPQRAKLVQHRSDIGTLVQQIGDTDGWFHIPIPTPSNLEGDATTFIVGFYLSVKVNDNAKIDVIHLRRGRDLIFSQKVSFVGTTINQIFDILPDESTSIGKPSGSGITVSIHVQFLTGTPIGQVEFSGAGGAFS
jgi:hypothetical protein